MAPMVAGVGRHTKTHAVPWEGRTVDENGTISHWAMEWHE